MTEDERTAQQNEELQQQSNETLTGGEQERPLSSREVFEKSIREKYPDLDEEGIYKHAIDSYGRKKKEIDDYAKSSGSLLDLLENNPDAMTFFEAATNLGSVEAAIKSLPKDVLQDALDTYEQTLTEEDKEELRNNYRQKISTNKNLKKKQKENSQKTIKTIEEYAKKTNRKPEDVSDFLENIFKELSEGNISENFLNAAFIDDIRRQEYERGLTDGRNGKIQEKTLRRQGSGLVQPQGKANAEEDPKEKVPDILKGITDKKKGFESLLEG